MKFIERQKLTRLEKSVKRQLQQLQSNDEETNNEQISQLQSQLSSIAMDQLYIAFYPTNIKYMALFTNGMERVVDDERGRKRRRGVWNAIREGLLEELGGETGDNEEEDGGGEDDGNNNHDNVSSKRGVQLQNAKNWVNLDAAKKALLSMPADTYPNASSTTNSTSNAAVAAASAGKKKKTSMKMATKTESAAVDEKKKGRADIAAKSDGRFTLSKELDSMFHESTTGDDYHKETEEKKEGSGGNNDDSSDGSSDNSSSSDDDSSSSSDDDADPLKGFAGKGKKEGVQTNSTKVAEKDDSSSSSESSSSSSSSSSSEDSDSDSSESSDSDVDPPSNNYKQKQQESFNNDQDGEESDDDHDDFFTEDKVSAEDVFAQAAKINEEKRNRSSHSHYAEERKPDKSSGFKSQNQSKREYRAYQHQKKRQKVRGGGRSAAASHLHFALLGSIAVFFTLLSPSSCSPVDMGHTFLSGVADTTQLFHSSSYNDATSGIQRRHHLVCFHRVGSPSIHNTPQASRDNCCNELYQYGLIERDDRKYCLDHVALVPNIAIIHPRTQKSISVVRPAFYLALDEDVGRGSTQANAAILSKLSAKKVSSQSYEQSRHLKVYEDKEIEKFRDIKGVATFSPFHLKDFMLDGLDSDDAVASQQSSMSSNKSGSGNDNNPHNYYCGSSAEDAARICIPCPGGQLIECANDYTHACFKGISACSGTNGGDGGIAGSGGSAVFPMKGSVEGTLSSEEGMHRSFHQTMRLSLVDLPQITSSSSGSSGHRVNINATVFLPIMESVFIDADDPLIMEFGSSSPEGVSCRASVINSAVMIQKSASTCNIDFVHPEIIDIEQPSFASRQYVVAYQISVMLDLSFEHHNASGIESKGKALEIVVEYGTTLHIRYPPPISANTGGGLDSIVIQQPMLNSASASIGGDENAESDEATYYMLQTASEAAATSLPPPPNPIIIHVAAGLDSDYWWVTIVTMSSALIGGFLLIKSLDSVSIWC